MSNSLFSCLESTKVIFFCPGVPVCGMEAYPEPVVLLLETSSYALSIVECLSIQNQRRLP